MFHCHIVTICKVIKMFPSKQLALQKLLSESDR